MRIGQDGVTKANIMSETATTLPSNETDPSEKIQTPGMTETAPSVPPLGKMVFSLVDQTLVNEETEEIPVYNVAEDRYDMKRVPKAQAVIMAGDIREREFDRAEVSALDTSMYPQHMHYAWVPKDTATLAVTESRAKQYAPVRSADNHAHSKMKVPGWGDKEVVVHGDLILTECPRIAYEVRETRRLIEQAERLGTRVQNEHTNNIENNFDDAGRRVTYRKNEYLHEYSGPVEQADRDRASSLAESLHKAEDYARMSAGPNRRSFGGFDGPMNKGAVPESPYLRAH